MTINLYSTANQRNGGNYVTEEEYQRYKNLTEQEKSELSARVMEEYLKNLLKENSRRNKNLKGRDT